MLRFFTSDLRRNLIKILCLTIGLSIGFLLIAKVYFESTYDTWFDAADRTYHITELGEQNGELKVYHNTPGAIAPGFKRYCPQVEAATRISSFLPGDMTISTDDGRSFEVCDVILADSALFEVFPTPVLEGNPKEVLELTDAVMIPRSLADKMGGDVVGTRIGRPEYWGNYWMTIQGVYEDFPLNSTITNAVYLAMPTIAKFSYDGRDNWTGNDRYRSYIRLAKGTDPSDLRENIDRMVKENCDEEAIRISRLNFSTRPLLSIHKGESTVKTSIWILSILSLVMLMCAALNYLLIVFGQMGKRGKEMAIRKCYGTSDFMLFLRTVSESLFFLIVSLLLAILIVECFSEECRKLLGYTPEQLFSTGRVWFVEGMVILFLLVITGFVPAWIYCHTPVTHAFRSNIRSRKGWKLALLSLQLFATGLLISILVLVIRQYSMLTSLDLGYEYENVGFLDLRGLDNSKIEAIVSDLSKVSGVERVATTNLDFTEHQSGNNVWVDENFDNQFNVADLFWVNPDFIDVTGMRILKGGGFSTDTDSISDEAMVDKRFVESLKKYYGVDEEDIIGSKFKITEHKLYGNEEFTIVGVFNTLTLSGIDKENEDTRPQVMFSRPGMMRCLYIKFSGLTPDILKEAQEVVAKDLEDSERYIIPYKVKVRGMTEKVEKFGTSVMIVGLAILLIALIGLVGYVSDEVMRRSKEIAIRKVSGFGVEKIISLFCKDILVVAVPSMIAGGAVAMIVGRNWLSQFSSQVSLSPLTIATGIICLLIIITVMVVFNSYKVANSNPVDHLRDE